MVLMDAAPNVRPTDDVGVIVGTPRYADYAILPEKLRKLGFKRDLDGPNDCDAPLAGRTIFAEYIENGA
jgi:hypothetical protein